MNQSIEDYLAGLFTSAQILPAPEVSTGTSSEIHTPESHANLVLANSIENVVGPLHRATVNILVGSPTNDRTQHAAITHAVKCIMEAPLPAANGFIIGGFRTKSNVPAVTDDDRWLTTIEGIIGVDRTPVDNASSASCRHFWSHQPARTRARHLSDLGHTMVSRIYALFDYSTELPRRHF